MRKIVYPEDLIGFEQDYLSDVFGDTLNNLQSNWAVLRDSKNILRENFPEDVTEILIADYPTLVEYYLSYSSYSSQVETIGDKLKKIFN